MSEALKQARIAGMRAARGHIRKADLEQAYRTMLKLDPAVQWAGEVYPETESGGAAVIRLTWEEWNAFREAVGLNRQPVRKRLKYVSSRGDQADA